jgi:hypothetical protein
MNPRQTQVVQLIQTGLDPVLAVSQTYQIAPEAALRRLTRVLKHASVYSALQASPVRTPQQPRRLMKGVYVAITSPTHPKALRDPKDFVRQRLHALLFDGALLSRDEWTELAADILSSGYLPWANPGHSDFFILSHALCDYQVEDARIHPERAFKHGDPRPHPEASIPRDLMGRSDLEHEAWWQSHFGQCKDLQSPIPVP